MQAIKHTLKTSIALFTAVVAGLWSLSASPEPPEGFTSLFNGKDLTGWHGMEHFSPYKLDAMTADERQAKREANQTATLEHWTVENGELINDGNGPFLTTDKEFGDIELLVDYKTVPKADSGIYLRTTPQVQIWDYTKEGGKWKSGADRGSGGLWNNSKGSPGKDPLVFADKPLGEWNHFRIIQVGERTTVYLNGKLVVDAARMENFWDRTKPLRRKGHIQLQTHGGEIRWRNIYIREIGSEEATELLASKSGSGYRSILDGKSLDGWGGPVDDYVVEDGAVMCRPGKGGTIYFSEELTDFQVRFEFQLPPGGNNGLAIRYPGKGNTAYDGMTELQVIDNTSDKYVGKIDDRQFHGSAYGMVAAHKGFLRPIGDWNYQEVTVKGSTIKVELNGTLILDADLSQVTEFLDDRPHPGKDRTSGYFGLAGHNDPVKFRNMYLKKLD
jgi:hypothetical protein